MKIFVEYDKQGQIISVTRADESPKGQLITDETEEKVKVLEVEPTGRLKDMEPIKIHEAYIVDVRKKKLVKKK